MRGNGRLGWRAHTRPRRLGALLIIAAALVVTPARPAAAATFVAPLPPPLRVRSAFHPPTSPWGAGNRGVDLAARAGEPVFAAADGVVIYAGRLAGRGVVSIDHGDALRTTYEPVEPAVRVGDRLIAGQLIGHVADVIDTCGPPGTCLHWGAIRAGAYIDPMSLLATPEVRLLPIWTNGPPAARAASVGGGAAPATTAPAATSLTPEPGTASGARRGGRARLATLAVLSVGAAAGVGALGRARRAGAR